MNPPANIFAAPMLNGLVRGEVLADSDKRLPFVAHQVGRGFDLFLEHAFDFIRREIGDHCGPGIAGGGRPARSRWAAAQRRMAAGQLFCFAMQSRPLGRRRKIVDRRHCNPAQAGPRE